MPITDSDVAEIRRLSENRSIRSLAQGIKKDLDQETLSKLMSAYLVLKADGHPDSDFLNYLTRKETGSTFKLGFKLAASVVPSLLTDGEFRSFVMDTRKELKREKQQKESQISESRNSSQ